MAHYLYLSFLPEALIFSMLPPERFGRYLALGNKNESSAQAIFFSLDPNIEIEGLDVERVRRRCVEHEDGTPRHSAYVGIYRVLERVPLDALGDLHLTTKDGLTLTLNAGDYAADTSDRSFLYQEICPVSPRVVSSLEPQAFCRYVTSPENPLYLPRLFFADMQLKGLATDPDHGGARDLPYPELTHLRTCLHGLRESGAKKTKIVWRGLRTSVDFYLMERGFYVGDQEAFRFYPMPDEESLLRQHHRWWNSATKLSRY